MGSNLRGPLAFCVLGPPYGRDGMIHKILCIDDDLRIRTMLDKALRDEGYDVINAMSGEDGVELTESQDPDLIRWISASQASTVSKPSSRL